MKTKNEFPIGITLIIIGALILIATGFTLYYFKLL